MERWRKVEFTKEEEVMILVPESDRGEMVVEEHEAWLAGKVREGVEIREVGRNLFTFRFLNQRDLEHVIAEGPWCFDRRLVVLNELGRDANLGDLARSLGWRSLGHAYAISMKYCALKIKESDGPVCFPNIDQFKLALESCGLRDLVFERQVKIWGDKWVLGLANHMLHPKVALSNPKMKVVELIDDNKKGYKVAKAKYGPAFASISCGSKVVELGLEIFRNKSEDVFTSATSWVVQCYQPVIGYSEQLNIIHSFCFFFFSVLLEFQFTPTMDGVIDWFPHPSTLLKLFQPILDSAINRGSKFLQSLQLIMDNRDSKFLQSLQPTVDGAVNRFASQISYLEKEIVTHKDLLLSIAGGVGVAVAAIIVVPLLWKMVSGVVWLFWNVISRVVSLPWKAISCGFGFVWKVIRMIFGSGKGGKTMKAPGRDYRMLRKDFETNPKGYFRNLRK
ncbi:hypothetical protein VNO78_22257 [Psophocarpus tetragonolobus]|uniref:DUF4283 domain-containing protein n=1 Tax=Psophocarpus tetragonolobus TaxID=3891 RepID=A0AAN9SCE0_PSOTE